MNKKGYFSPSMFLLEIDCRTDVLSISPFGWNDSKNNDFGLDDVTVMGGGL